MTRGSLSSLAFGALAVACATGAFERPAAAPPTVQTESDPDGSVRAILLGSVTDEDNGDAIRGASILLRCSCIQGTRETTTNADGLYSFRDLPEGEYTLRVLYGHADERLLVSLKTAVRSRVDLRIKPARLIT